MTLEQINKQIEALKLKMNDRLLCEGTAATITRISGYHRPIENWCAGKAEEFTQRLEYKV